MISRAERGRRPNGIYDQDMSVPEDARSDDGWNPLPGIEGPAERVEFDTLDFLDEVAHPMRGRILRQLKDPHSIAEVASSLSAPVTRLYHHINRLEEAGLIRVVATRKVAAVTERRYQVVGRALTAAPKFFESHDAGEVATALGAVFDMAKLGLQQEVETGALRFDEADNSAVLSFGHSTLTPERSAKLISRLADLMAEFESDTTTDDPDATTIALLIAAYPESD
jgi:DNA-binding transcriptional ArsR family regulator